MRKGYILAITDHWDSHEEVRPSLNLFYSKNELENELEKIIATEKEEIISRLEMSSDERVNLSDDEFNEEFSFINPNKLKEKLNEFYQSPNKKFTRIYLVSDWNFILANIAEIEIKDEK